MGRLSAKPTVILSLQSGLGFSSTQRAVKPRTFSNGMNGMNSAGVPGLVFDARMLADVNPDVHMPPRVLRRSIGGAPPDRWRSYKAG